MKIHAYSIALALGLSFAISAAAHAPVAIGQEATATTEQIAANDAARALGKRIYQHDQAAWHGSDFLFGTTDIAKHPEVRGYLTEELPDGRIALVYYAEIDSANYEFARLIMNGKDVVEGGVRGKPTDYPLSPALERLVKARQAALELGSANKLELCSSLPANIVTLPPDEADEVAVYILSSQDQLHQFPLGGHYRYKVNKDGQAVSGRFFSPKCFDVPIVNESVPNRPLEYAFAHVLDPQPHEIHYFVSQNINIPLAITAGGVLWMVERDTQAESANAATPN
ncbi:MAG: hypothetical protein WAT93_10440 [Pontixanthobacter sp.]